MSELLNSVESRELQIMSVLYEDIKWWSVQDLAEKIGYSTDTIYISIANINSVAQNKNRPYLINVKQNWGVQLEIDSSMTIDHISSIYIYNSLGYKILTRIFEFQDLSMQKLSDDLYFSKSTVYRKLLDIKKMITLNNLTLNMNTLEISGDEIIIRHLMYTTYWSAMFHINWPFTIVAQSIINHRVNLLTQLSDIKMNDEEQTILSILLAVNFIRHQKKQFIGTFPNSDLIDPIKVSNIPNLEELFSNKIPTDYFKNELKYLASFGLIARHCGLDELKIININTFHQSNQTLAYLAYKQFIETFERHSNNLVPNLKSAIIQYQLTNFFIYSIMYHNLHVERKYTSRSIKTLRTESPFFMSIVDKVLDDIYGMPHFKDILMTRNDSLVDLYFILTQHLDLNDVLAPLKVRLICSINPDYEESLKRTFQNKSYLNLTIHTSKSLSDEQIKYDLTVFDLLISDQQKMNSKHCYSWQTPPNKRDWDNIKLLLETIYQESL